MSGTASKPSPRPATTPGTTTRSKASTDMSHYPERTPCSSAAMPERSTDASSTPWPAPAACTESTSSNTSPTYLTDAQKCQTAHRRKPSGISSRTAGQRKSRANDPAFFMSRIRHPGDAYVYTNVLLLV